MLPSEIQNKIFYMVAEHPLTSMFKKQIQVKVLITSLDNQTRLCMTINDKRKKKYMFYISEKSDYSEIIERKIKSYKMNFLDPLHKHDFINCIDSRLYYLPSKYYC